MTEQPPHVDTAQLERGESDYESIPSLRVIAMPKDTNNMGTIFGGVILSYLDQAGFVEARKHGNHRWVTVSITQVLFHEPVFVGDMISFYTRTVTTGTTSVTVGVFVQALRYRSDEIVEVTNATLTFVAVDRDGQPVPFRSPSDVEE